MKYEMVRFGDYLSLQKGISYTSGNLVEESDTGLLTINAFITGGGYKQSSEKPFEGDIKEQFLLSDGDVLVAMTEQDSGLLASPLVVKVDQTDYSQLTFSLDVARVQGKGNGLDPRFVFNVLRIPAFRIRAAYGDTGSTVQRLPYEALSDALIPKPPIPVQEAIVSLLDSIDEKIRVNQQIASTLEQIAQTIFKSWFVDFDPVHAKARGEQPVGMDAETAALFPDSFEDSELGPIPAGWTVKAFGDACNLVMGQSPPGDSYNSDGNGLPFYQGRTDFGDRFPSRRMYTTAGKRIANEGETLISVRAPVGDTNQATEECVIGRGVAAAIHKSGSQVFTYSLLTHLKPQLEFYNGEGTVFGAINRKDFEALSFVEPATAEVSAFEKLLGATNTQIRNLHDQTTSLTSLRDSLLPRLISGELEIPTELLGA